MEELGKGNLGDEVSGKGFKLGNVYLFWSLCLD